MSRGKMIVVALSVLIAALLFQVMVSSPRAADAPGAGVPSADRRSAPDLVLPVGNDKHAVTLANLKGKVVLLDFWATWCGPCRMSIPDLEKLYEKYHDKGLEVYGISVDQDASEVPAAVKALGMTYPVVLASEVPGLHDKFDFNAIPQMYIVDKKGRIAGSVGGYDPTRDIEAEVTKYLKE